MSLAVVALIWGTTFVLVKGALADVSALLFVGLRFALASVPLAWWALRRREQAPGSALWIRGICTGMALFAGYALQTWGLRFTTPAKSGFLTGLYVPFVPLLGALVYRRFPTAIEMAGVLAATVGTLLMTLDWPLTINLGDAFTIGCAVAYSIHILLLDRFAKQIDVAWLAFIQVATCAVAALLLSPLLETVAFRWSLAVALALPITAFLATALAFVVQTWAQKHTSPARTVLIFSLEPVFAALTSYLVLGEILSPRAFTGALLIFFSIIMVEFRRVAAGGEV